MQHSACTACVPTVYHTPPGLIWPADTPCPLALPPPAEHFQKAHHPCPHPRCLERKFIVFKEELELKQHMAREHGDELGMSRAQRREALTLPLQFSVRGAPTMCGAVLLRGLRCCSSAALQCSSLLLQGM